MTFTELGLGLLELNNDGETNRLVSFDELEELGYTENDINLALSRGEIVVRSGDDGGVRMTLTLVARYADFAKRDRKSQAHEREMGY